MTFGLSAAAVAGISAGVSAIGVGLSAAGAAGAFSGDVDKRLPTQEELAAQAKAREVFALGRRIQNPLDRQVRQDIQTLSSPQAMTDQAGLASSQVMGQLSPRLDQASVNAAMTSGGPGSGRWANTQAAGGAALSSGMAAGNVQGRLKALQNAIGAREAFLSRRTGDLNTGLNMMTQGAGQSAMNRDARIQSQVANNVATNQAVGQMGGSLIGLGMSGLSAAGGLGALGGASGASEVMDTLFA